MLSGVSYISAILVAFFLFFNGIGTTITHPKCVKWARKWNIKIANCIRKTSRRSFNDINETLYLKLSKFPLYMVIAGMVLSLIFRGSLFAFAVLVIGALLLPVILIGLTSFKRLLNGIKENAKKVLFVIMCIGIVFLLLWSNGDKKLLNDFVTLLHLPKGLPLILLAFAVVNLIAWLILRLLTKAIMYIAIRFARLCYILNNTSPLKPFYLMFQIGSVLTTEIVVKIIKHFWC